MLAAARCGHAAEHDQEGEEALRSYAGHPEPGEDENGRQPMRKTEIYSIAGLPSHFLATSSVAKYATSSRSATLLTMSSMFILARRLAGRNEGHSRQPGGQDCAGTSHR